MSSTGSDSGVDSLLVDLWVRAPFHAPMSETEAKARYHLMTYGCRVNQADAEGIRASLEAAKMQPARGRSDASLVVLHSCTVTHRSDADIKKAVQRIKRENPGAEVLVSGCYAQRDPDAIAALPGTSAVVGHAPPAEVAAVGLGLLSGRRDRPRAAAPVIIRREIDKSEPEDLPPVEPLAFVQDRTRPFVKIQDGCDAYCTYCVIPAVRGAARSAPPERVKLAVERLVAHGYFEVVITGVHLGTYGEHLRPRSSLLELTKSLLEIEGLGRLRLSCVEPMAFPLELAELASKEPRLAPHFHLPLQSGSDAVLRRMARPYRGEDYAAVLREIRRLVPRACLATDVIVGFPGETEEDFEDTLRVVRESDLDAVHVFSYSDRPGVPSTRLSGHLGSQVIKDRARRLAELSNERLGSFLDRQVGACVAALSLQTLDAAATTTALSDHYAKIQLDTRVPPNLELRVRVTGRTADALTGKVERIIRAPDPGAAFPRPLL